MNKQKGITLIALVITIIILLILAGVSIASLTGGNGILKKAQTATEKSNETGAKEKVQVAVMGSFGKDGNFDKNELKMNLAKVEGIDKDTVPTMITEESFDLIVRVDDYNVMIKKNGEWDSELAGIWVAKYEISRSDATITEAGSSNTMKVVPNVHS